MRRITSGTRVLLVKLPVRLFFAMRDGMYMVCSKDECLNKFHRSYHSGISVSF